MYTTITIILDVVIAVMLIGAVVRGYMTGLLIKAAQLAAVIASLILAQIVSTVFGEELGSHMILPVLEKIADHQVSSIPLDNTALTAVSSKIAYFIVFILAYCIISLILHQLIKVFHIVDFIPVVGFLNRIGGAVVGFLVNFVILYIVFGLLFGLIPQTVLDGWGLTQAAVNNTILLGAFVP